MPDIRALVLQQLQYVDEIVIALAAVHRQLMAVIVGVGHERQCAQSRKRRIGRI